MTETFYDLLGVATDADAEEIERSYRQRIKETHPDLNDDPDASEVTARLVEARDVLTDADERARYDRLGHDAYLTADVGPTGGASDVDSPTGAANETRSEGTTGPTNARASAAERRRRERQARADVDFGDAETGSTGGDGGSTASTTTNGGAATTGGGSTASGDPPSWSDTSDGWAARAPASPTPGLASQVATAVGETPATAVTTFFLYPLLVVGTFYPAFPLAVNLVVGACLLASVAAVQSVTGLGVAIYGSWTVAGTIGLLAAGQNPFSPIGLVVLGTTWLPLGFSLLTYHVLDS